MNMQVRSSRERDHYHLHSGFSLRLGIVALQYGGETAAIRAEPACRCWRHNFRLVLLQQHLLLLLQQQLATAAAAAAAAAAAPTTTTTSHPPTLPTTLSHGRQHHHHQHHETSNTFHHQHHQTSNTFHHQHHQTSKHISSRKYCKYRVKRLLWWYCWVCLRNIVVNIPPPTPPPPHPPQNQVQNQELGTSPKTAFPPTNFEFFCEQFETAKFNTHTPEVGVQIM